MNATAKKIEAPEESSVVLTIEPDRKQLAVIGKVESAISIVEKECMNFPDVTTEDGMAIAKDRLKTINTLLSDCEDARVAYVKPLFDEKKRVDTLCNKGIKPRLEALKAPLSDAIKAERNKIVLAEKAKAEAEQKRIEGIKHRIVLISTTPATLIDVKSIDAYSEKLDIEFSQLDEFDEFSDEAKETIVLAREKMAERRERFEKQEKELEEARAIKEKQAEEQRKIDEEKAKLDREARELQEERAAIEQEKAQNVNGLKKLEPKKKNKKPLTKRMSVRKLLGVKKRSVSVMLLPRSREKK